MQAVANAACFCYDGVECFLIKYLASLKEDFHHGISFNERNVN